MTIQPVIAKLQELGPLPSSKNPDLIRVEKYQGLLEKVTQPISDEEACILVHLLGPDDYFGLAWTLIHLVETAPNWPIKSSLENSPINWIAILKQRAGI